MIWIIIHNRVNGTRRILTNVSVEPDQTQQNLLKNIIQTYIILIRKFSGISVWYKQ